MEDKTMTCTRCGLGPITHRATSYMYQWLICRECAELILEGQDGLGDVPGRLEVREVEEEA